MYSHSWEVFVYLIKLFHDDSSIHALCHLRYVNYTRIYKIPKKKLHITYNCYNSYDQMFITMSKALIIS